MAKIQKRRKMLVTAPCAFKCNYSPLEGVRGVEPSPGEGRVRLQKKPYLFTPVLIALRISLRAVPCSMPRSWEIISAAFHTEIICVVTPESASVNITVLRCSRQECPLVIVLIISSAYQHHAPCPPLRCRERCPAEE